MWYGRIPAIESGFSGGFGWQCSAVFLFGFMFFLHLALGGIPYQAIQDSAICESLKGKVGGPWGWRLHPLEVCSVIYLIPLGERTYGRVIGEETLADVPVTSFLVYAEKEFEFKM